MLGDILSAIKNLVVNIGQGNQQLSTLNTTIGAAFPQASSTIAGTAGSATGTYLAITINGVSYKIALLSP